MSSPFFTPSQDWQVQFLKIQSIGLGIGASLLRLALRSPETGFNGEISIRGSGLGAGAAISGDYTLEWLPLDVMSPFSPDELYGARGTVLVPLAAGSYVAGRLILLSAKRTHRKHFFHNAILGSDGLPSAGWGAFIGAFTGQWKIDAVWGRDPWW